MPTSRATTFIAKKKAGNRSRSTPTWSSRRRSATTPSSPARRTSILFPRWICAITRARARKRPVKLSLSLDPSPNQANRGHHSHSGGSPSENVQPHTVLVLAHDFPVVGDQHDNHEQHG